VTGDYRPPRPPRRPHRARRIVIGVVLLALVLIVIDRGACWVAERQVASRLQSSQQLPATPTVRITGFPFLSQLARRHFTDVKISADGLDLQGSGRAVRISHLDADLRDVKPSRNLNSATVKSGTGIATISYPDLSTTTGLAMSYGGNGQIKATKSITVLGQTLSGSVTATVSVQGDNLIITGTDAQFGDVTVPQQATDLLLKLVNRPIPMTGLPAGLKISSVVATEQGLVVSLVVNNLTVS
jgi:DUF2993 family protein